MFACALGWLAYPKASGLDGFPPELRVELSRRLTPEQWTRLQAIAEEHPEVFAHDDGLTERSRWIHAIAASLDVYATDCLSLKDYDAAEEAFRISLAVNPGAEAPDASFDAEYGLILALQQKGAAAEIGQRARAALAAHELFPESGPADKYMISQLRALAAKK